MTPDTLVWHYTATYEDQDIGIEEVRKMHALRGFSDAGYHHLVRLGGEHELGRPEWKTGAHVLGQNTNKIGAVTVGGLRRTSGSSIGFDTRTEAQKQTQVLVTEQILRRYPTIKRVIGHRDLAATLCPAYDVNAWWLAILSGSTPPPPLKPEPTMPTRTRPFLRQGARGTEVIALQNALKKAGTFPLSVESTGYFGSITEDAVREFQSDKKLVVDGLVGNATWAALIMSGAL